MTFASKNQSPVTIAVDVMGGDHGSPVVVRGALRSFLNTSYSIILVGNKAEIQPVVDSFGLSDRTRLQIEHAADVIEMHDSPAKVLRGKVDSSIRRAFELVQSGRAQAVISTGNTGAVMAAGVHVLGTLSGIARPAIATLIPRRGERKPLVLLDSGANVDCNASQLSQFALMGAHYARVVLGIESPRVALLSNGSESSKGNDTLRSAAMALKSNSVVSYVGYIEGRDFAGDIADVVVCDGFVGNVVLKTMEGTAKFVIDSIKDSVKESWRGKLGLSLASPLIKRLVREKLDPAAYGGAPLLGLKGVGIVCHGSSNERAIDNAVRVAERVVSGKVTESIAQALDELQGNGIAGDDIERREA
jgi:glycerol-3-phosphate acyltransferase PlsX